MTDDILHPIFLAHAVNKKNPEWCNLTTEDLKKLVSSIGPISGTNWNKLQAVRTVLISMAPFEDYRAFSFVVQALNGKVPDFRIFEPLNIPELMGGAQIIYLLSTGVDKEFEDEIYRYAAAVADYYEAGPLPEPLSRTSSFVLAGVTRPELVESGSQYVKQLNELLISQVGAL